MITFDENGYPFPYEIIELNSKDLERYFVKESTNPRHRAPIFEQYLLHTKAVQDEIGGLLFQFVNGSFTTLKEEPKDIDVVSFIDYRVYREKEEVIGKLEEAVLKNKLLDGFIAPKSYPGHPYFMYTQLGYENWRTLFSFSRKHTDGKRHPKGLIKITF